MTYNHTERDRKSELPFLFRQIQEAFKKLMVRGSPDMDVHLPHTQMFGCAFISHLIWSIAPSILWSISGSLRSK